MSTRHRSSTAAAALAVIALAGCGADSIGTTPPVGSVRASMTASTPETITVRGTLLLYSSGVPHQSCTGDSGYKDIHIGTQVTVKDSNGLRLAIGHLGAGTTKHRYFCLFHFIVPDVPADHALYNINVSSRRGDTFSREDLDRRIRLTIR